MKISKVAKYLKKLFRNKDARSNMSDKDIIKLDYFECISYLYKGIEKPIVIGFKDGVFLWINTTVGLLELDSIPHDEGHLTKDVMELEVLIGEKNYDEDYVVNLVNKSLTERWNR